MRDAVGTVILTEEPMATVAVDVITADDKHEVNKF